MTVDTITSIFLGIGLAASCGFRVFLPLFVLSLATYFGAWDLNENWQWVGSLGALITLGVATVIEIFAYLIPWVDNALDGLAMPLATLAGTAVVVSTMVGTDPLITWSLALIAGGGSAALIKGASAGARLTSSVTTGGVANPVISTVETATASLVSITAVIWPTVAIIFVIFILGFVFWIYRKFKTGGSG